jgi:small-conductance mechanosensitive channel
MHGLVIVYSRALRVGEFVRMGAVEGRVKELGTLSIKVVDHHGDEVTVPNTTAIGGSVLNFTRLSAPLTEHGVATVSIGYDVPWRQVVELLHEAARRTAGLRRQPAPVVLQRVLSDFAVEFELIVQIELPAARAQRMSSLNDSIRDVFEAAGVQILSPHYIARVEPTAADAKDSEAPR